MLSLVMQPRQLAIYEDNLFRVAKASEEATTKYICEGKYNDRRDTPNNTQCKLPFYEDRKQQDTGETRVST